MNATTNLTCWCGTPATYLCSIDPEVTPWDGELRTSDREPANPFCLEHVRDGYEAIPPAEEPAFQLGSWSTGQLHNVRAVAVANGDNEALVIAIDAELQERVARGELSQEERQLDGEMAALVNRDKTSDLLARLILESEGDFLEELTALAQGLPTELWTLVAQKVEACPVHICDEAICRDDQNPECPAGREAAGR